MGKVNMKDTEYYISGRHVENVKLAAEAGGKKRKHNAKLRRQQYALAPNKCTQCGSALAYEKRNNKFCSSSCSATYSNTGRKVSEKTKRKIKNALFGREVSPEKRWLGKYCTLHEHTCSVCGISKLVSAKKKNHSTCGKAQCKVHASVGCRSYPNGKRKLFEYYCLVDNKTVILESTWELELAEWLDAMDVKWVRPNPIKWTDDNKTRLYYPDFYLCEYDLYLDPKNPWAMENDKIKMSIVSKKVDIVFGDIEYVKQKVLTECRL